MRRTGDFEQRRGLPPSQGGGACIGLRGAPLAFFASSYKAVTQFLSGFFRGLVLSMFEWRRGWDSSLQQHGVGLRLLALNRYRKLLRFGHLFRRPSVSASELADFEAGGSAYSAKVVANGSTGRLRKRFKNLSFSRVPVSCPRAP